MKKNSFRSLIFITLLVLVTAALITPLLAQAQQPGLQNVNAPEGTPGGSDLLARIGTVINGLLVFVAVLALIYVIIGGVRYILSQGDQEKALAARRTILYAIIGLIIIALAAVIVNFVLGYVGDAGNTGPSPTPTGDPVAPQGFLNVNCLDDFICDLDATSFDPGSTASYTYDWDFGDGSVESNSSDNFVSHQYATTPGLTYAITLTVTNTSAGLNTQVTASAKPSQDAFGFTVECVELNCTLNAQSIFGAQSFQWVITSESFVDITETSNPVFDYEVPSPGDYTFALTAVFADSSTVETSQTVTVTASSQSANATLSYFCSNLICTFDGSASTPSDLAGFITDFEWDFGEGAGPQAGSSTIIHQYAAEGDFIATLRVTDSLGAIGDSVPVTISPRLNVFPTAAFGQPACAPTSQGMSCVFDGSSSIDPDGSIANYLWDFGAGAGLTGSGVAPTYTYAAPGSYDVTLTVIDNQDAADTTQLTVTINAAPPIVAISINECTEEVGVPCTFSNNSSDPDGGTLTLDWLVDGISVSTSSTLTHTFTTTGLHTVELAVTDDEGSEGRSNTLSLFIVDNRPELAIFKFPTICTGLVCPFSINIISSDGPVRFDWDPIAGGGSGSFINGTHSGSQNPTYEYSRSGFYEAILTATDDSNSLTERFPADPSDEGDGGGTAPIARVEYECSGFTCQLNGIKSFNAVSWDWDLDNNGTIDATGPFIVDHVFPPGPLMIARLRVSNSQADEDTVAEIVEELSELPGQAPPTVTFTTSCIGDLIFERITCTFTPFFTLGDGPDNPLACWTIDDGRTNCAQNTNPYEAVFTDGPGLHTMHLELTQTNNASNAVSFQHISVHE